MKYITTVLKTSRIEGLSDGIFAISMTILILSFEVVLRHPAAMGEKQLLDSLFSLLPDLLHYVESFILLGVFWFLHHQQFHYIKKTDAVLVFINILGLMFVGLVPFTTVMVSDYGQLRPAALLFEINLLLAGLTFFAHWVYATGKNRLIEEHLDAGIIKYYKMRNLIIPALSFCAMAISLLNPRNGIIVFFAVPFILVLFRRREGLTLSQKGAV
ncbi:MAG: TMEM175 family protein [Candidatus Omnitrophota bacterium]